MPTNGWTTVNLSVDATRPYSDDLYSGWGPFRTQPLAPTSGNQLRFGFGRLG